jgi:hypothetical protein
MSLQRLSATLSHLTRKNYSTMASEKFEWLVIMPDVPGTIDKRIEVRPYVFPFLSPSPSPSPFLSLLSKCKIYHQTGFVLE